MNKIKRITASILCVVMLFSAFSAEMLSSLAQGSEPSSEVTYKMSEMSSVDELTKDGNITVLSYKYVKDGNNEKLEEQDTPIANGELLLGSSGGRHLSVVFLNAYNDTENGYHYPVTSYSARLQLGTSTSGRAGSVILFGKEADQVTTDGGVTTTVRKYVGNTINMAGTSDGLKIIFQGLRATHTIIDNGSAVTESYTSKHDGDGAKIVYDAKSLAAFISDDAAEQAQIQQELKAITSLSDEERWVTITPSYLGGSVTSPYLTLNLHVGGKDYVMNMPLYTTGAMVFSEKAFGFGAHHSTSHADATPKTAVGDITVTYDLAEYYAPMLEQLESKITALGTLTKDKQAQVEALYAEYQQLPEAQKPYVKNASTLINALDAFNNGAYFFDSFETDGLNWQVSAPVGELIKDIDGEDKPIPPEDYRDNLTPTNEYSEAAAENGGDENGNAFWGKHSTTENPDNHALWLRKSFNYWNMRPTDTGNVQTWPSVAYITKDVLPEGTKITFVSGKMYLPSENPSYKVALGVAYKYSGEFSWETVGLHNQLNLSKAQVPGITSIVRTGESNGRLNNNFNNYNVIEGKPFSVDNHLALAQWVDFELRYDFSLGCYTYKVSGVDTTNRPVSVTVSLPGSNGLMSEVALVNGNECNQSFDDIAIGLFNSDYAESEINRLPSVDELTLDDEKQILTMQSIINQLPEEEQQQISNMDIYNAVYARYQELLTERDSQLTMDDPITFEPEQPGMEYFEAIRAAGVAGWGVVANPGASGLNQSANVLEITRNYANQFEGDDNRAVYKIKDTIMPGSDLIANFTGKLFLKSNSTTTVIYDYQDPDHWTGYELAINGGSRIGIRKVTKEAGSNSEKLKRESVSTAVLEVVDVPGSLPTNGLWVSFNVEYQLLQIRMSISFEHEGKTYTGQHATWNTLADTCETKIGFATGGTAWIDDVRVTYQGTDGYTDAQAFLENNDYILNLIPASTYISVVDEPYVEKVVEDYANLSAEAKLYLPYMDITVAAIQDAWATVDPNSQQAKDDQALQDKAESAEEEYTSFTFEDDFEDGLRGWQPARDVVYNTGTVTTEYHEMFDSMVLKMQGISTITPKSILLPDKPQLSSVSFSILREPDDKQDFYYRLRVYTDYIDDTDFCGYGFYQNDNPENFENGVRPKTNYRVVYPDRSVSPVDCDLKMDQIWYVSITYNERGSYTLIIKDGEGENANTFVANGDAALQSLLALASFNKTTYIDDLKVTYRHGNYDIDEVNDEITVYYTGNTLQSAGDYVTLSGENLAANVSQMWIAPVANGTNAANKGYIFQERFDYNGAQAGEFSRDPVAATFNKDAAVQLEIVQKADNSVKFRIPAEFADGSKCTTGVYAVRLIDADGFARVIYINTPVIDYTVGSDGDIASPGTDLRVIGKNLAPTGNAADVKAVLQQGNKMTEVPVSAIQSNYSISLSLPLDLETGEYELWLYNGYGDDTAWAVPVKIKVDTPIRDSWKQTVYNIKDFGATGESSQNATPIFVNALSAIANNGGGTLYIPAGSYAIESELVIPNNTRIIGENVDTTVFVLRPYNWAYRNLPKGTFLFEKNVEISNISVVASRAGGIFRACGSSSDNIYLNNIYTYIQPSAGAVSEAPHDITGLLTSAELTAMVSTESCNPIIAFQTKGDNVQIKNVDISDSFTSARRRRPVVNDSNGSKYWQVDNLATSGAWSEVVISYSLWENSAHGPNSCMGVWGHGLYFANTKLFDNSDNNRELYVADRNANYRGQIAPLEGDATGTKYVVNASLTAAVSMHGQLYIYSGQGVGQTRTITSGQQISNGALKQTIITIDRPFVIEPNRNSGAIIRRPRENIYFVENSYENGGCGGFYGGFADVVYDGCDFVQVTSFYQQGIFSDVNWYLSIINTKMKFKGTLGSVGNAGTAGDANGTSWQALSGVNAQMCFLMRDCEFDGLTSYIRANGSNTTVDFVLQRNEWMNADFAFEFYYNLLGSRYENINGMLLADNLYTNVDQIFEEASQPLVTAAMNTTNQNSSKRMIVLDKGIGEIGTDLLGDVNGDNIVSLKDSTLISFAVVGMVTFTDAQNRQGDVNRDGLVNMKDASLIKMLILGKITEFPDEGHGMESSSSEGTSSATSSETSSVPDTSSEEQTSSEESSSESSSSSEESSSSEASSVYSLVVSTASDVDEDQWTSRYY